MAKQKTKVISFNFRTGKLGRIPSSQNNSIKINYVAFKKEFAELASEEARKIELQPSIGLVHVFIAQLFRSEKDFKECDADNMIKFVIDTLKGICYIDDGQVISLLITKDFKESYKDDFYFIAVKYLGKDNDPGNLNKEGLYEAKELYSSLIGK